MYGDTSAIRAHARRMRERAGDIRAEVDSLRAAADAVPWTGVAAEAMRHLAREHAGALRSCASAHDEAADALERHAHEVDRLKDLIATIERRAFDVMEGAGSGLVGLAGHLVPSAVDRWVDDFDPPQPGSRGWLDVHLPHVG